MNPFDKDNVESILDGRGDWFTACLLRLIIKADRENRIKLHMVYPEEVNCITDYLQIPRIG